MALVQNIVAFVVALAVLVSVHEYGHFWLARRCGVKVLRFSIGFGKALFSWRDRLGTEYVIAPIPLGGYIRMLDEREAPVAPEERSRAFNRKHPLIRMGIVLAGPAANFLLAFVVLWLVHMIGLRTLVPVVGDVVPGSPAAVAGIKPGEEIVAVSNRKTRDWDEVDSALLMAAGQEEPVELRLAPASSGGGQDLTSTVRLRDWRVSGKAGASALTESGIIPWQPKLEAVIGGLMPGEAAEKAGLQVGDRILAVDGQAVSDWMAWVAHLRASPGKTLKLDVMRHGEPVSLSLTPSRKSHESGPDTGFVGAEVAGYSWPADKVRTVRQGPVAALRPAFEQTLSWSALTATALARMVTGQLSMDQLSGPVGIARAAGASMASGVSHFLGFLAMLSISLGIINLLPVPVLDGGHFLYHMAEWIRGRPLSQRVQDFGMRVGVILILGMMCTALFNDFSRM